MRDKNLYAYDKEKMIKKQKRNLKWLGVESIPNNLMEFLQLDFMNKDILLARMSGQTLQEVGDSKKITRERIRQIVAKTIKILPPFDDVVSIEKLILDYDITEEQFVEYFQKPKEIFQFIKLKNKKRPNIKPFEEYLLNLKKVNPQKIKEVLRQKKKFVNYQDDIVDLNINNVMDQILFDDQSVYTVEKLQERITKFYVENGYEHEKMLSNRALEGRLIKKQNIIHSTKGKFRYYQYDVDDLNEYVSDLNELFNVSDGIYGIDYFFETDKNLMNQLDIRNGPELANVLKKIGYEKFDRLNGIMRQSQVYIGDVDYSSEGRLKFYKSVVQKFDGFMLDELIEYIHEVYYLHKGSVLSYVSKNFAPVIHEKKIVLNVPLPTEKQFYDEAEKIFQQPIYTFDQVKKLLRRIDSNVTPSPQLISKLGYYERGTTIISNKYDNQDDAFKALWLTKSYVFLDEVKSFHNRITDLEAYNLELSHDLIRVDYNRYMTINKFEQAGFTKDDINNFINEVVLFTKNEKFYSWKYLLDKGFESDFVNQTGFDSYFYERLLFTSPAIRTIQTNGYIFINSDKSLTVLPPLIKFIEHELGTETRDVEDFTDDINQKYGLSLYKSKIIEKLKKSALVYSPEMNKIYPNKQQMYNEIYNLQEMRKED